MTQIPFYVLLPQQQGKEIKFCLQIRLSHICGVIVEGLRLFSFSNLYIGIVRQKNYKYNSESSSRLPTDQPNKVSSILAFRFWQFILNIFLRKLIFKTAYPIPRIILSKLLYTAEQYPEINRWRAIGKSNKMTQLNAHINLSFLLKV